MSVVTTTVNKGGGGGVRKHVTYKCTPSEREGSVMQLRNADVKEPYGF